MKVNRKSTTYRPRVPAKAVTMTHGGGLGTVDYGAIASLRRQVATCMLYEDTYYKSGDAVAAEIAEAAGLVPLSTLADVAMEARNVMKLRHVPLYLLALLDGRYRDERSTSGIVRKTIPGVVQRADEMAELLAIIAKMRGVTPDRIKDVMSHQVARGLRDAFRNFNSYNLAKYRGKDNAVKLRDVMFLVHPKPYDTESYGVYSQLADNTLAAPDTWETALSSGADPKLTWERLLREGKLGGLALLRNLRGMEIAGVERKLVRDAIRNGSFNKVLPFRFVTAYKNAPMYGAELDAAMLKACTRGELGGVTVVVVDVSGSMSGPISGHSEMDRIVASSALAAMLRESGETVYVYATAGSDTRRVHKTELIPREKRGLGLVDAISLDAYRRLGGGGIFLSQVMSFVDGEMKKAREAVDRVIVITDEQDCDNDPQRATSKAKKLGTHNYILNVAPYGVGFGVDEKEGWTRINGFSERSIDFIKWNEFEEQRGNI